MKTALLHQILEVVSSICEIPCEEIVSHTKRADVVDARVIFVYYASRYGFPTATIAKFINRTRVCSVNDHLANYKNFSAQSVAFRLLSKEVDGKLRCIFPETPR